MYIWIWVTIAAALSQSLRTAQQKNLQPVLGNLGASFVRFSYAIPFAWAWIIFYSIFFDIGLPELNLMFFFLGYNRWVNSDYFYSFTYYPFFT